MDSATFLNIVIILVTGILVAVGIYLILLLNEARQSFKHINKILEKAESASIYVEENLIRQGGTVVSALGLMKQGLELLAEFKKTLKSDKKKDL